MLSIAACGVVFACQKYETRKHSDFWRLIDENGAICYPELDQATTRYRMYRKRKAGKTMNQLWKQLKVSRQARKEHGSSTIGVIGGADGPTAVFVTTKPDGWLGTLLGLMPWGTGIISAGLLLGWCRKEKKRLLLPTILSAIGCAVGAKQAVEQAAAVQQAAKHMPEIPMPSAMLRTAAANAFSTGLWVSMAALVCSLAALFRHRTS